MWLFLQRPPNVLSNSAKLLIVVGSSTDPLSARPTNTVIEVPTPTIVLVELGSSRMYTPG
jgi:hypothetical protein